MTCKIKILFLISLTFQSIWGFAQKDTVYLNYTLDEITLTEHRNVSAISGTMVQGIRIDSKKMETYPKLFGYTDPMQYIQSLPGVTTINGCESGMHVQGGETSQNLITLSDVPVYSVTHLLGLFSIFNQDHVPQVRFSTSTYAPFLAAQLSLDHADTIPDHMSGVGMLGIISAQGSLNVPFGRKTALTVSARRTFMNAVYGNVLMYDDNPVTFGFTDLNLTLLHQLDQHNKLDINMFYSFDEGSTKYGKNKMSVSGSWDNGFASLRWRHNSPHLRASTSAFVTGRTLESTILQDNITSKLRSYLTQYSIKTDVQLPLRFRILADASYYSILPQRPEMSLNKPETSVQEIQQVFQADAVINRTFRSGGLSITPTLLITGYREYGHYKDINADPALTLEYDMFRRGNITFESGVKHQYLTQTGMTNIGLPIEFYVASGHYFKPQKSLFATLSYDLEFLNGKYALTFQTYGKRLENQIEYTGFFYDIMSHPYRLEDNILICSGYNYGVSLMLTKQAGGFTGWLGYSYNQSLREGDGINYPKLFHSSFERRHEFNAVVSYKAGRFDLGGMFLLASGIPYTPAKNLYIVSNTVIIYYDEYNSLYLPPMTRLDLSATYNLRSHGKYSHGINLSLYNAFGFPNKLMGYLNLDTDKQTVKYDYAQFIVPVIPSISYFCRF